MPIIGWRDILSGGCVFAWLPAIGGEWVSGLSRLDHVAFLVHSTKLNDWFGDRQGHDSEYHLRAISLIAIIIVHSAGPFSPDRALYRRFASSSSNDFALDFNLPVLLF